MMASIPNMRSTPLPVPAAKAAPAGDSVPGDFAAQMPAVPGASGEAIPSVPSLPVELVIPVKAEGDAPEGATPETKADLPETGADAPEGDGESQPAIVIPVVQPLQALPAPLALPTVVGGEVPETAVPEPVGTGQPARLACDTGRGGKPGQPLPAVTDLQKDEAEVPQPVLAALDPQPAAAKATGTGTVEGTRVTDLAVERQLDLARGGEWLDRLARDIARAGASDAPLRFRLHPQTLGSLQVELQQSDRGTAVRLTVETEAARQILADAQPRLAAEARSQGVRIAETHVDLSNSGRDAPGDRRRQDEAGQTPLIRTARGAGAEAAQSARPSGRARLDRYA